MLVDLLDDGGTLLFYGGLADEPVTIPTMSLTFRKLTLRGVSTGHWPRETSPEQRREDITEAIAVARSAPEHFNITAEYDLAQIAEAVVAAEKPGRPGAIILNTDIPNSKL